MATLKVLRTRISAIHSTKKITKAMKLISSAKYLNTRNILKDVIPYYTKIEEIAENLLIDLDEGALKDCPYVHNQRDLGANKLAIFIIISSDKGLCGGFNVNIMKALERQIKKLESVKQKYKIFFVGNKGFELAKKQYSSNIIEKIPLSLNVNNLTNCIDSLIQILHDNKVSESYLIYNEYKSQTASHVVVSSLLPFKKLTKEVKSIVNIKEYEPKKNLQYIPIFKRRLYIKIKLALLESIVSENFARMVAMDGATNNAQEMVDKLTLLYNRTRQGNITSELIEIISGAEALSGN